MQPTNEVFTTYVAGIKLELPVMITKNGARIAFFDIRLYPQLIAPAANQLSLGIIEKGLNPKFVVSVNSKGPLIAQAVAEKLGLPLFVIHKNLPEWFTGPPIKGTAKPITASMEVKYYLNFPDALMIRGDDGLLVDDVISSGNTKRAVESIFNQIDCKLLLTAAVFREGMDCRCWYFGAVTLNWLPVM